MLGHETNILYRENFALTHRGEWDFGSSLAYLQYEKTRNSRINEGWRAAPKASSSTDYTTVLRDLTAHGEVSLPLHAGVDQVLTLGTEWVESKLDDPSANTRPPPRAAASPA
jgi:ferric enterobactin receptor